jgi:hypothetical protein
MSRLGIVLIVACVIADMAMPLCPGAFRLDPLESVHGVGSRTETTLPLPLLNAPSAPTYDPTPAESPHLERLAPRFIAGRLPRHASLPRSALGSPSQLSPSRSLEDG